MSSRLRNVQICQGIFHIIHTDTLCFLTLGNVQLPISVSHKKYEEEKYSKTSINIFTWTTLTTNTSETGRDKIMMKRESPVISRAQTPAPSSHSDKHCHQVSQSDITCHKHVSPYDTFGLLDLLK